MQEFILLFVFIGALSYLGSVIYRHFKPKNGVCSKGCGSCQAVDFKKLEKQIKQQQKKQHA